MKRNFIIAFFSLYTLACNNGKNDSTTADTVKTSSGVDSMPIVKPQVNDSNTISTPSVNDSNVVIPDTSKKGS